MKGTTYQQLIGSYLLTNICTQVAVETRKNQIGNRTGKLTV